MAVSETLHAFLIEIGPQPRVPGRTDCLHWLMRWIERARGVDLSAHDLPIKSEDELQAALDDEGGHVAAIEARAAVFGLSRTDAPEEGSIAVVGYGGLKHGAISVAGRWAIKGDCTVRYVLASPEAVWSIR